MAWMAPMKRAVMQFGEKLPTMQHLEPIPNTRCWSLPNGLACHQRHDGSPTTTKHACTCCANDVDIWCLDCNRHVCGRCSTNHHANHRCFALQGPRGTALLQTAWSPEFVAKVQDEMRKTIEAIKARARMKNGAFVSPPVQTASVVDLSFESPQATHVQPTDSVLEITQGLQSLDASEHAQKDVLGDVLVEKYTRWNKAVVTASQQLHVHAARVASASEDDLQRVRDEHSELEREYTAALEARTNAVAEAIAYLPVVKQLVQPETTLDISSIVLERHAQCAKIAEAIAPLDAAITEKEEALEAAIAADDYDSLESQGEAIEALRRQKRVLELELFGHFGVIAHHSPHVRQLVATLPPL
ncbi:hypothetical protein SDRG_06004 [Saprolegnia diclina VS20]|uniref:B box-type domain-containing protein n=1 Tax=Saprolegnia diclina (strain VS20) TaxID=1156394 RepID=T0QPA0_SAPDV|nr:hypothetical protein SDRG_06004 [Saprolegnia diclina VS20]EQC36556.1 hypothetical protein SDRG_06004 [Saprolegnia diclina VS20]|eukprot:XP_008609977.1 hypothetical protein SDRG_06004 [Saprolegnia diclina VS20]